MSGKAPLDPWGHEVDWKHHELLPFRGLEAYSALQIALLGKVTPGLRGVAFNAKSYCLHIYAYFEGDPSDNDLTLMNQLKGEVALLVPPHVKLHLTVASKDLPAWVPNDLALAYKRLEASEVLEEATKSEGLPPQNPIVRSMSAREKLVRGAIVGALAGTILPKLRAVSFSFSDNSIHLNCFFDGEPSESDHDWMLFAESELMDGMPEDHEYTHSVIRLDYPIPIPQELPLAYLRYEP